MNLYQKELEDQHKHEEKIFVDLSIDEWLIMSNEKIFLLTFANTYCPGCLEWKLWVMKIYSYSFAKMKKLSVFSHMVCAISHLDQSGSCLLQT